MQILLCILLVIGVFWLIYKFGVNPVLSPYGHHTNVYEHKTVTLKNRIVATLANCDIQGYHLGMILADLEHWSVFMASPVVAEMVCREYPALLEPSSRVVSRDEDGSFWIFDVRGKSADGNIIVGKTLCHHPDSVQGAFLVLVSERASQPVNETKSSQKHPAVEKAI